MSRVLGEGADAGALARAALARPTLGPRVLEHGDLAVRAGHYPASAVGVARKLLDQAQALAPEKRLLPFRYRNLPERVGPELVQTRRFRDAIAKAPAGALTAVGKKLSTPQQVALRVVAEGVPIVDRIAFHERQLADGGLSRKFADATRKQVALLQTATQYVHDVNGLPRFKPEHGNLIEIYEQARNLAHKREQVLQDAGVLGNAEPRVHAPGNVILHGEPYPGHVEQLTIEHAFDPRLVPEVFTKGEF